MLGILIDEPANISVKKRLSCGLRFLDKNTNEMKEESLGFLELDGFNTIRITKANDEGTWYSRNQSAHSTILEMLRDHQEKAKNVTADVLKKADNIAKRLWMFI